MYEFETEKSFCVEYWKLEEIIQKEFPMLKNFSCVADQEWHNDSDHVISFEKEEIDEYALKELNAAKLGKCEKYILWTLMQDLVNRDILPEGNYRIEVCW